MQDNPYLTTEEAASYLRIGERKLYELVAERSIPCSKVTGKWLFPRAALDAWVVEGMSAAPPTLPPPPAIIGGSHDPLLEWAARGSGSGLALLAEGSARGLERLERNEVMMAAIHLHDEQDDDNANLRAAVARPGLSDAVLIAFVQREQGLVLAPGNPLGLRDLMAAVERGARFGLRQKGAGALFLLSRLLARQGADLSALNTGKAPYPTGADLALAIRSGEVDCGIATRAVAAGLGLDFLPLHWERFDLALRQRSYFHPSAQALFRQMREAGFAQHAALLGGFDMKEAGEVRLCR